MMSILVVHFLVMMRGQVGLGHVRFDELPKGAGVRCKGKIVQHAGLRAAASGVQVALAVARAFAAWPARRAVGLDGGRPVALGRAPFTGAGCLRVRRTRRCTGRPCPPDPLRMSNSCP